MSKNDHVELLAWQERISELLKKHGLVGFHQEYRTFLAYGYITVLCVEDVEEKKRKFVLSGKISGVSAYEILDENGFVNDFIVEVFVNTPEVFSGKHSLRKIILSETQNTSSMVFDPPFDHGNWQLISETHVIYTR